MKQILSFLAAGLLFLCISCSDEKTAGESKDSSAAKKNLEASHVVSKAFETGDVSGIDSVIASDFVDHTDRGDKVGPDSLKAMINWVNSANKDMKVEIVKELADDEYVFSWLRFKGTSSGGMGMPAGPYDFGAIEVVRFKDGKAVEHWGFMEPREMMKMMGQPGDSKMEMKDTSNKK